MLRSPLIPLEFSPITSADVPQGNMRKLTPAHAKRIRERAIKWAEEQEAKEQAQDSATSSCSTSPSEPVEPLDSSSALEQKRSPDLSQPD